VSFALNLETHFAAGPSLCVRSGSSGFGNLLAQRLDKLGMRVYAGCLTPAGAAGLKTLLSGRSQVLLLDVTNERVCCCCVEVLCCVVRRVSCVLRSVVMWCAEY
jgi:hypothetical protein